MRINVNILASRSKNEIENFAATFGLMATIKMCVNARNTCAFELGQISRLPQDKINDEVKYHKAHLQAEYDNACKILKILNHETEPVRFRTKTQFRKWLSENVNS